MSTSHSLSIVIPMYQESQNVAPMLEAVHQGLAGYAGESGADPNRQNVDRDHIRQLLGGSFTYSLHTTRGTSGSPVFYTQGRDVIAVGVHSRSHDATTNRGTRLDAAKIGWIWRTIRGEAGLEGGDAEWSEESALDLVFGAAS